MDVPQCNNLYVYSYIRKITFWRLLMLAMGSFEPVVALLAAINDKYFYSSG